MVCLFRNSSILLDAPTESRKTCASKAFFFVGPMPDGGTFLNIVLVAIPILPSSTKGHCAFGLKASSCEGAKLSEKAQSAISEVKRLACCKQLKMRWLHRFCLPWTPIKYAIPRQVGEGTGILTYIETCDKSAMTEIKLYSVMDQERQGLRFPFVAAAEISPESSPSASITASVKELSLHGCYVDDLRHLLRRRRSW